MKVELEQFSGPLDLLLSLIKENKLDISQLSLSAITEQYLQYLDKLEKNKEEELADFLVIGTRLLYLKSRLLLPQFAPEAEEEESLAEQLKLYKLFVDASRRFHKIWQNNYLAFFRIEPPRKNKEFIAPANLSMENLRESLLNLLVRLKPLKPLPQTTIDATISMKEKIDNIRSILRKVGKVNFFEILGKARNRTEIIVSFLALLELVKQKTVFLKQSAPFGDIAIEKV